MVKSYISRWRVCDWWSKLLNWWRSRWVQRIWIHVGQIQLGNCTWVQNTFQYPLMQRNGVDGMPAILHVSYLVSALYGCLYLCLFLYVCELTKSSLVKPYGVWTLYFISLSRTRCDAYLALKATFWKADVTIRRSLTMHAVNNLYRCQMVRHSLQAPRGLFFKLR